MAQGQGKQSGGVVKTFFCRNHPHRHAQFAVLLRRGEDWELRP